MPGHANLPAALTQSAFSLEEARAAGVSLRALQGKQWKRIGHQLYCWIGWPQDAWKVLAAWHRSLPDAVFGASTAAWMHGLDLAPLSPVEMVAPPASGLRSCFGARIRRCQLAADDIVSIRQLPVTSLGRTLRDLCHGWTPVEALVAIDMALHRTATDAVSLWRYAVSAAGTPGSRVMRELVPLAAPAESPMETRLRWLIHRSGLPRPQVQAELRDGQGRFIGRADLYYPRARLVIEFDGRHHVDRLVPDNRRQNQLVSAHFTVLRYTTSDLQTRPEAVVAQVRDALESVRSVANEPKTGPRRVPSVSKAPYGDAA